MDVVVTCKNQDQIKNEGARVLTAFFFHYNFIRAICCHGNQCSDPN